MGWRLGVVGSPVAHSLSPQLHAAALAATGRDGTSERWDVSSEHGDDVVAAMGSRFDALSVTMPLKMALAERCHQLDEVAQRVGAVNSVLWRDGELWGANTDGRGLLGALATLLHWQVDGAHVVLLGAGGAARSIVDACVEAGAASVTVHGRNVAAVEDLTRLYSRVHAEALVYRPIDLIINTTPATGRPDKGTVLNGITPETVAVDITYEPRVSAWLAAHDALGCRAQNGLPMLAFQAALQASWWFGELVSGATLLEAL